MLMREKMALRAKESLDEGILYRDKDCIGFIKWVAEECGFVFKTAGVNTAVREGVFSYVSPITNRAELPVGCLLFIHDFNGGEPAKYRGDGIGDYWHIGIYVGEKGCEVVHSSASRGCVAVSTLENAWNYYGELDFGASGSPVGGGGSPVGGGLGSVVVPVFAKLWEPRFAGLSWRLGDKGDGVREVQEGLQKCGYGIVVDGVFGRGTDWAVRHFQEVSGIVADGVVGRVTWKVLVEMVNKM